MAVSGRKVPGFKDLLFVGSTEDVDICCDPCKILGKTVEAKGFCVNCQENLCKRCEDYHKSTKASRHHSLLDQPQKVTGGTTADSDDSKICTEYCKIHKKEVIMFFCSRHNRTGCTDCMTLDHKACNIDYIPDVCSGISKSTEFSGTLQNVSKTLKEVKLIELKAQSKKNENRTSVAEVIKEIEKFQKKMNDRIEQLKQQLVTEANSHRTNRDQEVDKISKSCARVLSELNQVHVALKDCQSKKLDTQAFVTMKQAQWILSSTNIQAFKEDLTNVLVTIVFELNSKLENVLSQQYGLGRLILPLANFVKKNKANIDTDQSTDACVAIRQKRTPVLHSFKQKTSINVRTNSDKKHTCYITGCAAISADRLLLADSINNKLKIVNVSTQFVVEDITVDLYPWDVTVLPRDQVAVTFPKKQKILILWTAGVLTSIRNMNFGRQGWGIDYHQDYLYVVCQEPNSLLVLDMQGNVWKVFSLQRAQDQMFSIPSYIKVGKKGQTLYISDSQSHFVASLTLEGDVTGVYKDNELKEPLGLVVLEDGSILVCCGTSDTIHHISTDLKQGRTMLRNVSCVRSICCYPGKRQICVGANNLSTFSYE